MDLERDCPDMATVANEIMHTARTAYDELTDTDPNDRLAKLTAALNFAFHGPGR
jgi:hypothetical protein